ncbi:cysteine proteinase [Pholiota conissans]|uniref:ubiquitinyl hydrolase 1 n=1 Tax=Pholiota conissans TaxID=109636 RepID=A0A9P5Z2Z3_9AGAR|nr:cysteine proteinase [Pholiota conissans]
MRYQEWAILILKSPLFQQVAPLVVLFLIPALVFFAAQYLRRLSLHRLVLGWFHTLRMGLDSLGFSIPWLWSSSSPHSASSSSGSHGKRHKKSGGGSKNKLVRTRAEQIAMNELDKANESKNAAVDSQLEKSGYYPGLVNISGTYCFMNSTLQAMASLSYLQPHIDAVHAKAEALDVPTPVIDALQELFTKLNTPKSSYNSLRPHDIISVLSQPQPPPPGFKGTYHPSTASSLFTSREHQDAQELFQLVSECIKNETMAVDWEAQKDRGIAGVLDLASFRADEKRNDAADESIASSSSLTRGLSNKSVFDGLTANRRSCVVCGYTEAVMHFGFDNWQLALPRLATSCRLEDCLEDYTRLEILKDCICRKCSVMATHKRLLQELQTLKEVVEPNGAASVASTSTSTPFSPGSPAASSSSMPSASPTIPKNKVSTSKKKRFKEVKRMELRVRTALAEGRIEDESFLEGVRLERVVSPASTKQAMIARPPPVLALHLNRSVHYGQYASKNIIRVHFPEVLDLTPYTTSGSLSTVPTSAISTPTPLPTTHSFLASSSGSTSSSVSSHPPRPRTPTPETYASEAQRTIYRLSAVVCHYGQHSFGHYICYRRKPKRVNGKWVPPTLVDPLRLELELEDQTENNNNEKPNGSDAAVPKMPNYAGSSTYGETRYYWEDRAEEEVGIGRGWLRISDDAVSECGIESVLAEGSGAFMLYYEKAVHPRPGVYLRGRGAANGHGVAANGMVKAGRSRSRGARSAISGIDGRETDGESLADTDADGLSIGSEETLKPEMKVVDLHGSLGSLVSEVGVGVMKSPKKAKAKVAQAKSRGTDAGAGVDMMSMSTHLPLSIGAGAGGSFGPRIVRSVNARRRNTPSETASEMGSIAGSPAPPSVMDKVQMNGAALHINGDAEPMPSDMTASAPSILNPNLIRAASATKPSQPSPAPNGAVGIGSKTTRIMHHPSASAVAATTSPTVPGVKAR